MEWLSFCESTKEQGVAEIRCEGKGGGEAYVIIERSQFASQIDAAFDETIGVFLREEKERRKMEAERIHSDTEDEDEKDDSEDGEASVMSDFIDDSDAESKAPSTSHRRILSSDEEDVEDETERRMEDFPYQNAAASLNLIQREAALERRRLESSESSNDEKKVEEVEDHRPPAAKFRFSKKRQTLRFKVDGLGRNSEGQLIVFE